MPAEIIAASLVSINRLHRANFWTNTVASEKATKAKRKLQALRNTGEKAAEAKIKSQTASRTATAGKKLGGYRGVRHDLKILYEISNPTKFQARFRIPRNI